MGLRTLLTATTALKAAAAPLPYVEYDSVRCSLLPCTSLLIRFLNKIMDVSKKVKIKKVAT